MKRPLFIGLTSILLILALFYFFSPQKTTQLVFTEPQNSLENQSPEVDFSSEESTTTAEQKVLLQYPSLDGSLVFVVLASLDTSGVSHEKEYCPFEIRDKKGKTFAIDTLVKPELVCVMDGTPYSTFGGWMSGNKFLLTDTPGEVQIVDVINKTKSSYLYDGATYSFMSVNKDATQWLFRQLTGTNDKEITYVVFDSTKRMIGSFAIAGNDRGALYDPINNGFVFISRDFGSSDSVGSTNVSVRFDYVGASTTSAILRHILTTDIAKAPGRGCVPETIISEKPGEIIITPGCLTVNKKYLGSDGNIHITLQ